MLLRSIVIRLCDAGSATTQIYGGMTEAGKMVRSAGSQLTGAFKGLWSKTGKGAGSHTTGDPTGMPGAATAQANPAAEP